MEKHDENQLRHLELVAVAAEKGQSFNSVFIAVGYATFFGLWKNIETCSTTGWHMMAGALLTFSVAMYVAWMVMGLYFLNITMMTLVEQVSSSSRPKAGEYMSDSNAALKQVYELVNDPKSDLTSAQRVKLRLVLRALEAAKTWKLAMPVICAPALLAVSILFSIYVHGMWIAFTGTTIKCAILALEISGHTRKNALAVHRRQGRFLPALSNNYLDKFFISQSEPDVSKPVQAASPLANSTTSSSSSLSRKGFRAFRIVSDDPPWPISHVESKLCHQPLLISLIFEIKPV